ncbi:MAG: sensor histidine kinase [Thiobacillus sp.]|nr:sensor histidine kinase [Thiobacillus sp.]
MPESGDRLDITTFLLSAIHDMKNSLGVMVAFLEDALAAGEQAAPARARTAQALYEAQRVNEHLMQLLALYKIDQRFYPFDAREQVLADLAREALARVHTLARSRGVTLRCDCAEGAMGWFDYELVYGVTVQALHNALRYARSQVLLHAHADADGSVEIRIEDDGPGFPDFLLERDAPGPLAIRHDTGNTGLGLYFARVVAHLHGSGTRRGTIHLSNGGTLGGGRLVLRLP